MNQPYLRRKGKKWIIEKIEEGKTKYIMTLPPLQEIINRHGNLGQKPSRVDTQTKSKSSLKDNYPKFVKEIERKLYEENK